MSWAAGHRVLSPFFMRYTKLALHPVTPTIHWCSATNQRWGTSWTTGISFKRGGLTRILTIGPLHNQCFGKVLGLEKKNLIRETFEGNSWQLVLSFNGHCRHPIPHNSLLMVRVGNHGAAAACHLLSLRKCIIIP